jgi:hypothetical protein
VLICAYQVVHYCAVSSVVTGAGAVASTSVPGAFLKSTSDLPTCGGPRDLQASKCSFLLSKQTSNKVGQ